MLFCSFVKCTSLREVSGAMLGLLSKMVSFNLNHIPKRSTLSDANKNRMVDFIEDIFRQLPKQYGSILSVRRIHDVLRKQVKIIDSSTIILFNAILNCLGSKSKDEKSKLGLKLHTVINADEQVSNIVWLSPATTNLKHLAHCQNQSIYTVIKKH